MRPFLKTLLVLALLLAIALAALAWRLAQGPLSLAGIQPVLETLLARRTPFVVSFEAPALAWSAAEGTLAVTARDVELRNRDGEFVLSAPSAAMVVDAVRLLRDGALVPVALDIELPELELLRNGPGSFELAFAGQLATLPMGAGRGGGGPIAYLLGGSDPRLQRLERLRVRAPILQFVDTVANRDLTAEAASVVIGQDADGWSATLTADLAPGEPSAPARLVLLPELGGSDAERVVVELDRAPAQQLTALMPFLPAGALQGAVSGSLSFRLDGPGVLPAIASFTLRLDDGVLTWPERFAAPLDLHRVSAAGTLDPSAQTARLQSITLESGAAAIKGTGTAALATSTIMLDGNFTATRLDVPTLLRFWPLDKARNARLWVSRSLSAGDLGTAHLQARLPRPGASDPPPWTVDLAFAASDLTARYLGDLPPAKGLTGTGRLTRELLELEVTGGRVEDVELSAGKLRLAPFDQPEQPPRLTLQLALDGPVRTALAALDAAPLHLPAKAGVDPAATGGRFTADVGLEMPVRPGVKSADIDLRVRAKLRDASLVDAWRDLDLTEGELTVDLADHLLTAQGTTLAAEVPARFEWRERLPPLARPGRRVSASATLDPAAAGRLGLAWPALLGGALGVEAVMEEAGRGPRRFDITADLAETVLGLPALGVSKLKGAPGRASFRLLERDTDRLDLDRLELDLPDLALRGRAELRLNPFDWQRLQLDELTTPVTRLSADLVRRGPLVTGIVDAARLDLRPWRATRTATGPAPALRLPPLELRVEAAQVQLGDTPIPHVTGSLAHDGSLWRQVELSGILAADSSFSLAYAAERDAGSLTLDAEDGGGLLQALGMAETRIVGGRLRAEAQLSGLPERRRVAGEVRLRDFTLQQSPVIARIFTLASLQGLASALTGGGIPMARLDVPFAYEAGRVELKRARLVGSQIGARADGTIDLDARQLDLEGTVAPIYTLNRILGRVPLIGDILRGERADAALAATFAVKGDLATPEISVNPFSALVPGVIRDLFRGLIDGEADEREPEKRD